MKEEQEEERAEKERQKVSPLRNPDAQQHLELSKQQNREDSFRADSRREEARAMRCHELHGFT